MGRPHYLVQFTCGDWYAADLAVRNFHHRLQSCNCNVLRGVLCFQYDRYVPMTFSSEGVLNLAVELGVTAGKRYVVAII